MASYQEALSIKAPKREKPRLVGIHLKPAENGGVIAEHHMSHYDGADPAHAFGADEGHKLAAHLEKHLGIKMGGSAESVEGAEEE